MIIKGAKVFTETGCHNWDVLVGEGRVKALGWGLKGSDAESVIDASGLYLLPGLMDIHVHVDGKIGPFELADTWESASKAAIKTGVTTLASFATQNGAEGLRECVSGLLMRAAGRSYTDYTAHFTPIRFDDKSWGEIDELKSMGFNTMKLYTTYRKAGLFTSYASLKMIMEQAVAMDLTVLLHCEDEEQLEKGRAAVAGRLDPLAHTKARPPGAEEMAVERVLSLAGETGAKIHIVHVSTVGAAERVISARANGVNVTMETAPHYLFFNDEELKGESGHRFLCSPPLRGEANRKKLIGMARRGVFDLFATDHCAFSKADKDAFKEDFRRVPCGLAGVGSLVPLVFEKASSKGGSGLDFVWRKLGLEPARVLGVYPRKGVIREGADADLVLVDLESPVEPVSSTLADAYDSFIGMGSSWNVKYVFLRGEMVVKEGEPVKDGKGHGKCLNKLPRGF